MITTKTIKQGATREASLKIIKKTGGEIYFANSRVQWPGKAQVRVALFAAANGRSAMSPLLDGVRAETISSFLFDSKLEDKPTVLLANKNKQFEGSKIYGAGFLFEDGKPDSTDISTMRDIIASDPESAKYIKVYVGGEQANNQPAFEPKRFVIDFGEMTKEEARQRGALFSIVQSKVYPERSTIDPVAYRRRALEWWKHAGAAPNLYSAISGNRHVLVANCQAAKYLTFIFLPTGFVYANSLTVFADDSHAHFAVVQSRVHELWARMFGTSMKDDLRYTGTTCYENFPFPVLVRELESIGQLYSNERASAMVCSKQGLTKLNGRLNSPDEQTADIVRLRSLHAAMDKAVLDAYGWSDIVPVYEFSGDYENDDGSAGSVRLNFTEEVRDEILRRLLALHAERLKAEQSAAPAAGKADAKAKKPKKSKDSSGPELF